MIARTLWLNGYWLEVHRAPGVGYVLVLRGETQSGPDGGAMIYPTCEAAYRAARVVAGGEAE